MFNNLFLKAASDSKSDRAQLSRLLTITAPHERLAVGCIWLVVLAFAAWFLFGSVMRSVTLEGVLIVPGERRTVVTGEPGQHLEYLVAPGDRVQAGQAVARQSVPTLERELAALRDRLSLLRSQDRPAAGDGTASQALLASAEASLLQMEARRAVRQTIVSGFAGVVVELSAAPGEYLPDGAAVALIHETPDRLPEAVLRVDSSTAQRIQPGMEASVEVGLPGGGIQMLRGTVARVTAGPLPDWLARLEPAALASFHRIDIVFDDASGFKAADGTECLIRIELGQHAPADLFLPGRS
ncbi:MAG: HlyD family efflux transporter periplasmic adaptor subunit [Alphaproteobacteria bacterium]|nr:HlyD family efflux transporter periplasmic adaptor subunit [Alphaproteobacteria bacterium]